MKKNNKKGISPLIATVIVIGFTIVLAALVITWGTRLFKTTVSDTEIASKFNLACTTGLKLEVSNIRKSVPTTNQITVSMRNNNQDRDINGFKFVPNPIGQAAQPTPTNSIVVLPFAVPKDYAISTAPILATNVASIDIYPQFVIDGQTKYCDTPLNVRV